MEYFTHINMQSSGNIKVFDARRQGETNFPRFLATPSKPGSPEIKAMLYKVEIIAAVWEMLMEICYNIP